MKRSFSIPPRQSGLSLVELMIALTIGFMIVAGVGYVYLGSRQAFRTQDSLSTIQENARYALDIMSQKIRMAGYIGCGNLASVTPNNTVASLGAANAVNPATALQVFPDGALWLDEPATVKRVTGDVLRIYEASGGGWAVLPASTPTSTVVGDPVPPLPPCPFKTNDILLVSDCQKADIFTATSDPKAIAHAALSDYKTSTPAANVYAFQRIDYFLGCPTASWVGGKCSVPVALYQVINGGAAQALVDNVEDMAFRLGVDTTGTAKVVNLVGASPTTVTGANNWDKVLSVQVHLLLAGGQQGGASGVTVTKQHYAFNGANFTATDNRLYQEVVATVAVRNRTQ